MKRFIIGSILLLLELLVFSAIHISIMSFLESVWYFHVAVFFGQCLFLGAIYIAITLGVLAYIFKKDD